MEHNNHRYTYMNGRPARTNQHLSAERSAFEPSHNSLNKQSTTKQAQGEKINDMANKIMLQVNRLYNPTHLKAVTKEMLKDGGSKIFYDVFAILARAIDDKLERQELTLDHILGILKVFSYPGFLGKNVFQPIGAPHTWIHCLSILDFMAEIAKYSAAFKAHAKEVLQSQKQLQRDENYLIMQAIFENNPSLLIQNYEEELLTLSKKVDTLKDEAHKTDIHIRNLHAQQQSVQSLTEQIQYQKKRLQQAKNQNIRKEMEKERLQVSIQKKKKDLKRSQETQMELYGQLSGLEYRIAHNQLTAEETKQLEDQVRQAKREERALEQQLNQETHRIKSLCEQAVSHLKITHSRVKHSLKQILETPLSSSHQHQINFTDNFDELSRLCDSFITAEEMPEKNISEQISKITESWGLEQWAATVSRVVEQSKSQLYIRENQLYDIRNRAQAIGRQDAQLNKYLAQLNQIRNNKQQKVNLQLKQLTELRFTLEKLRMSQERLTEEIEQLKQRRIQTEEYNIKLMDEIQTIQRQAEEFHIKMKEQLARGHEAIERAKLTMLTVLHKNREKLIEVLGKSRAGDKITSILNEMKKKSQGQIQ